MVYQNVFDSSPIVRLWFHLNVYFEICIASIFSFREVLEQTTNPEATQQFNLI